MTKPTRNDNGHGNRCGSGNRNDTISYAMSIIDAALAIIENDSDVDDGATLASGCGKWAFHGISGVLVVPRKKPCTCAACSRSAT